MSKKTYAIPSCCPACGGGLYVSELRCTSCSTEIRGRFGQSEFAALDGENLRFLRAFIAARGSIKEVEMALGISYPTVRARLEKLIEALGLSASGRDEDAIRAEIAGRRSEILSMVERGEIEVGDAERMLGELRD